MFLIKQTVYCKTSENRLNCRHALYHSVQNRKLEVKCKRLQNDIITQKTVIDNGRDNFKSQKKLSINSVHCSVCV